MKTESALLAQAFACTVLLAAPAAGRIGPPDEAGGGARQNPPGAEQGHQRIIARPLPPEVAARLRLRDQTEREAEECLARGDQERAYQLSLDVIDLTPKTPDGLAGGKGDVYRRLGRICLRRGRNAEALVHFQNACRLTLAQTALHYDMAIACCRLGDRGGALRVYSDEPILERLSPFRLTSNDLPGTATLAQLEASALLGRALVTNGQRDAEQLTDDLLPADRLAPHNAVVAWFCGSQLAGAGRYEDALDRFGRAAAYGRGLLAQDARRRAESIADWQQRRRAAEGSARQAEKR